MAEPDAPAPVSPDPQWYKDAIIYELHVKAFYDANGDGIGDFRGLTDKLDYVQDLGVNTIWLLPFYPSPQRDDGYDIADYRAVHASYGSLRDFRDFVRQAHRRGLRVITELVVNHTSDQHPWFQAARRAPRGSAKRDYYVWSDDDHKYPETRIIFTDTEKSNWAWDEMARQYYWHRFFSHQPDLNHNNPQVVKAVTRVMRFWLDMGVDGMRLDAIPYLCVREGTDNENLPETHDVIRRMRAVIDANYGERMFLAEANQWPEDTREYFGDGDECHMAYHFPLMPRMFMALAQEDRHPIADIMGQTPEIPPACQWAIFLRNHDELTLEMVTDRERDYMYRMYAREPNMRINVGIRRRLAPLLDNDMDSIKLMNSLLLSMPGSPIIYYGDEIGMGDNIFLGDRNGVRTPMQWGPDRNAGFSRADPQRLYLPPVMDAIYGYEAVNVEAQSREPSSLLNWMKRLIAVRKGHRAFGRGSLAFLHPANRKVLAYMREHDGDVILCVANLSRTAQPVVLDLQRYAGCVPVELTGGAAFPPIGEMPYVLTLPGHGFYWFRLARDVAAPPWFGEQAQVVDLPVLVLREGLDDLLAQGLAAGGPRPRRDLRTQLEREVLPAFLRTRRWFAAKDEADAGAAISLDVLGACDLQTRRWLLAIAGTDTHADGGEHQRYLLPLAILWEDGVDDPALQRLAVWSLAKVRQRARAGLLVDAFGDDEFCRALVRAMSEQSELAFPGGRLRFTRTGALEELAAGADGVVEHPGFEQSNTGVVLGGRLFLKGYRRLREGLNPELEMGRFLTERVGFGHVAPLAGALELVPDKGPPVTLALLQGYVGNQGDGWSYTIDHLSRFLPTVTLGGEKSDAHALYVAQVHTLGRRVGELHAALARTTGDPDFDPEPVRARDLNAWVREVREDVEATLARLRARLRELPESAAGQARTLLAARRALLDRVRAAGRGPVHAVRTRYHGDLHLGQVLVVRDDFLIIDFEGEPARGLAERRRKHSPLRDVAGMLRSFAYAEAVALDRVTAERPQDRGAMQAPARAWREAASRAFLAGHREGIGDAPSWPADAGEVQRLLDLFVLEKALYELRYELSNRPAWVEVPLRGLLEHLEGTPGAGAPA